MTARNLDSSQSRAELFNKYFPLTRHVAFRGLVVIASASEFGDIPSSILT